MGLRAKTSRILVDGIEKEIPVEEVVVGDIVVVLFLSGAFLSNISRGGIAYTQVDVAAGSVFVFVITMIISLSV